MTTLDIKLNTKLDNDETYRIGDFFLVEGDLAQLCQVGSMRYGLIDIKAGNRYSDDPVMVGNSSCITREEVSRMCTGSWVKVDKVTISID